MMSTMVWMGNPIQDNQCLQGRSGEGLYVPVLSMFPLGSPSLALGCPLVFVSFLLSLWVKKEQMSRTLLGLVVTLLSSAFCCPLHLQEDLSKADLCTSLVPLLLEDKLCCLHGQGTKRIKPHHPQQLMGRLPSCVTAHFSGTIRGESCL